MKSTFEIPYRLLRLISRLVLKVGFALKVNGKVHLDAIEGPVILAGNHTGFLDSLILIATCKRYFRFVMDEKVRGWVLIGKLVRHGNILPIDKSQPKASLKAAIETLRAGGAICIFPEGKLSENGQLGDFLPGVALLQEKSGATILPFAIMGGFEAWPHGKRRPRFHPVSITFGTPVPANSGRNRLELANSLKSQIANMLVN